MAKCRRRIRSWREATSESCPGEKEKLYNGCALGGGGGRRGGVVEEKPRNQPACPG